MAKLVTKFKYLKANARQSIGGYAKYIATREGVEILEESEKQKPATKKQAKLIRKILRDFPDCRNMLEYEDYKKASTIGTAYEFINRALEDNIHEIEGSKTYADYIATRPRAQRFGSHGLFTDEGVQVNLREVSQELDEQDGNVWTIILSLRREDAERLGFHTGERWREMLRSQAAELSKYFRIPLDDLRWYAAFHNESYHPHVHLMVYTVGKEKPYLSPKGVEKLRSAFAKSIFADELFQVYEKQTDRRNELRSVSREVVAEIVAKINSGNYDNPLLESKLTELADRLSKTKGKKQYGYLKADVKAIVNTIVMKLSSDERIAKLYDLWYQQKEESIRIYMQELPPRIPLVENTEFKSIKNAVIQEAMNIVSGKSVIEDMEESSEAEADDPTSDTDEAESTEHTNHTNAPPNMWRLYAEGKELLEKGSPNYNPNEAVKLFVEAAKLGCGVAKYRLGKLLLRGEDVPKNVIYALRWLEESAAEDNQYAEYLLGKTFLKGEDVEQDIERAKKLLRRSSDQGNRYACYTLGKALLDGKLLAQDTAEAIRLLTISADKNFAVAQYVLGRLLYQGQLMPQDISHAIEYLERAAAQKNPYAAYLAGKLRMTEDTVNNVYAGIHNFEIAAENGNSFAEYQLGKIYLFGKDIEHDYEKAIAYLTAAAEHGNQYASQLLNSIHTNRNWSATMGSIRLLHQLSRIIQNKIEEAKNGKGGIDRKLKRKIDEKKQAHGLKQ